MSSSNPPPATARDVLCFPLSSRAPLEPYLPSASSSTQPTDPTLPFVTLTYACSLDSAISASPGVQTALSGPESKAMTHYLRSRHDAILVGVGTVLADDPSLNCRLEGVGGYGGEGLERQPRSVVVDPWLRWEFMGREGERAKVLRLVGEGRGRAPWVVTAVREGDVARDRREVLEAMGGKFISVERCVAQEGKAVLDWADIFRALKREGIESVMVEGGGTVINGLLQLPELLSAVIVTYAPTWLGQGGVIVSPPRRGAKGMESSPLRLQDVRWIALGEDIVLCGRFVPH